MGLDDINVIDSKSLQAFIHTAFRPCRREVKLSIAIASHFGCEIVAIAWNSLQGLSQYRFGFGIAIEWRYIDEVYAEVQSSVNRAYAGVFIYGLEDSTQG